MDSLEARKEELFATMTLLNAANRQIYELQASGAPPADLAPLYERQAQLASDKERLAHEVNSEYMYRNLATFMSRVEAFDQSRAAEAGRLLSGQAEIGDAIGGLHAQIDALQHQFSNLGELVDDHTNQIASHSEQIEIISRRLDAHEARLGTLEKELYDLRLVLAGDKGKLRAIREQ